MTRHLALFSVSVAVALIAGCPAKVATVEVAPKEFVIKSDQDVKTLAATAKDAKGKEIELSESKKPTWTSADPAVAVVDSNGKVKPAGSGKTTITAKVDEATGTANVTVALLKGIKLESPAAVVKVGETKPPLKVAFTNEKGEIIDSKDAKVEWKTADPNVATVGPDGSIKGVATGSTTVTARVEALTADVAVTVNSAEAGPDAGPEGAAPEKGEQPGDKEKAKGEKGEKKTPEKAPKAPPKK